MRTWFLLTLAGLLVALPGLAANEYDVSVSGSTVTVKAKGPWHINKDYPWKLTVGDVKVGKDRFKLEEGVASVSGVPKGAGKLKGGVCNKEQCVLIAVDVKID